jgi:hypothetical protein
VRSTAPWPAVVVSALSLLALPAGCGRQGLWALDAPGGGAGGGGGAHAGVDAYDDAGLAFIEGGQCTTTVQEHPDEGAVHISCMDATDYLTSPPSSGNHYTCWAAYQTYAAPIPWGNLVHSLEHGAIVIVYNCPDGCTDDVANIQTFIDGLPPDTDCAPSLGKDRIILMPDPTLDVRFAASAWTWTLRADCFDPVAFRQFFDDHYDHGREVICSNGWQPDQLCSDICP